MTAGAHSRSQARCTVRTDLQEAIGAALAGDISLICRSCGYGHGPDIIAEHLQLGHAVLADVTDHRLNRRQLRRLATAVGMALMAGP